MSTPKGCAVGSCDQNQNQNQFYFRVDVKTLKQLWATIGDREVAEPSIPALDLFRACTLVDRTKSIWFGLVWWAFLLTRVGLVLVWWAFLLTRVYINTSPPKPKHT